MSKWKLSDEDEHHKSRMKKQGYSCDISLLRIEPALSKNVGGNLGQSRSKVNKYTYKINSRGYVDNSIDEVEVFISAIF